MKFSVFQLSNIGGRSKNEDRMGYSYTREAAIFLLADGMGGHPDGEVAAQLALESISTSFQEKANPRLVDPKLFLEEAILAAHHQILAHANRRGMPDSPRTTIVAAVIQDDHITFGHCGDSRAYIIRDHELFKRTRDHSYCEQESAGLAHLDIDIKNRNILFTCLGSPMRPIFDVSPSIRLQQKDKILLCSDGLWGPLDDDTIVVKLSLRTVANAIQELIDIAIRKGGRHCDNATGIALEWESPSQIDERINNISTDTISDGVFATTIQGSMSDLDLKAIENFDDEAIERSIAEINEAIRRTAARKDQQKK